jgi:hypothetical protein
MKKIRKLSLCLRIVNSVLGNTTGKIVLRTGIWSCVGEVGRVQRKDYAEYLNNTRIDGLTEPGGAE